jgi:3,4-dihydroxy-2-butanone 4-phosphate synthase
MGTIARVEVRNVKRLVRIDIQTPGSTIVLRGQNVTRKGDLEAAVALRSAAGATA